jgi:hypothetical protein
MHLCMQDDQNGPKTMVLSSADKTRLSRFKYTLDFFISRKQPSLTADFELALVSKENPRFFSAFSF